MHYLWQASTNFSVRRKDFRSNSAVLDDAVKDINTAFHFAFSLANIRVTIADDFNFRRQTLDLRLAFFKYTYVNPRIAAMQCILPSAYIMFQAKSCLLPYTLTRLRSGNSIKNIYV